jgi:hypothetical protein
VAGEKQPDHDPQTWESVTPFSIKFVS